MSQDKVLVIKSSFLVAAPTSGSIIVPRKTGLTISVLDGSMKFAVFKSTLDTFFIHGFTSTEQTKILSCLGRQVLAQLREQSRHVRDLSTSAHTSIIKRPIFSEPMVISKYTIAFSSLAYTACIPSFQLQLRLADSVG